MKIKKFPKKLPGSFWGITTFFNPAGYKNKYENYKIFRENLKKQGLKICAVEVAFSNRPFELKKEDAEILIQIRGNEKNLMWQKERMMNIGLKNLPKDCDKIAWLDCDIIFENQNWVKETSELLEEYVVVQPFSLCVWLPIKNKIIEKEKIPWGVGTGLKNNSRAFVRAYKKFQDCEDYRESGHVGFAWAARKEIFDKIGFYDNSIIGNSDQFICDSFYEEIDKKYYNKLPKKLIKHHLPWREKIKKRVSKSIFYTKGTLLHLWHGESKDRKYNERYHPINKYNFDPKKDIKIDKNELFCWSSNKKRLHEEVKYYIISRKEDYQKKDKIKKEIIDFSQKIDQLVGKAGIFLRNKNEKLYTKLKKYFPDKK